MSSRWVWFVLALSIFALDRATKIWVENHLSAWDTWTIIPGFVNLIHSENRGMAFSLFADSDSVWRDLLLKGTSATILVLLGVMLWQATSRSQAVTGISTARDPATGSSSGQRAALTLLFGGALGNLYDRFARGSVTDFLDVYVGDYHWPTFNVADSAITVGALLLAFDIIRMGRQTARQRTPSSSKAS